MAKTMNVKEFTTRIWEEMDNNLSDIAQLEELIKKENITNPAHTYVMDLEKRKAANETLEYVLLLIPEYS